MVTGTKIQGGGPWSWGLLFFAAILLTIAIQFLTRKSRRYEQILSGSAIALIGFGILASFGRGYQPIGFALVMGLVLGLIVGMVISVARALAHSLKDDTEIPREPKEKTRRVTEI
jgi:Na+/melibiose symporter-like transporter